MRSKEYNGHTNYETWLMAMWLDHHECEAIDEMMNEAEHDPHTLASIIEEWVRNRVPDCDSPWAGCLEAAVSEIDWLDIAEYFVKKSRVTGNVVGDLEGAAE